MMRPFLAFGLAAFAAMTLPHVPAMADEVSAAEAAELKAPSLPAISVATVETRVLSDRIIASGLVAAVEEVQVVPLIEGQPLETLVSDVGDWVAAGQVLARLSTSTLDLQRTEALAAMASAQAAIAQVEAQRIEADAAAAEANRVVERTTTLREQGSTPQSALDAANTAKIAADARVQVTAQALEAARAQMALAEARLETVDLYLNRTEVKAPVAGEIVARNARLGAVATAAGLPMFVITRDGALELRVEVAEADILRLAPGMSVNLRSVGMSDSLIGAIRLIEPSIDPLTRLGRARIAVDDAKSLRAGMFAEAEILIAEREGLAVPVTALGSTEDGNSVMRVREGLVELVTVTTGIRDDGWIEITSGLAAGDLVVAKAGAFVRSGDRVNPIPAVEAAE